MPPWATLPTMPGTPGGALQAGLAFRKTLREKALRLGMLPLLEQTVVVGVERVGGDIPYRNGAGGCCPCILQAATRGPWELQGSAFIKHSRERKG